MSAAVFGSRVPVVIDTSAWHRQRGEAVRPEWEVAIKRERLVACPAATLEILYSARDEREFIAIDETLSLLLQAPVTASVCHAALSAAREFGSAQRFPVADYLIAAAAAECGFGVLHADRHFDLLAEVLEFESVHLPEKRDALGS
jgi:predicted nucleic acid-binding protein